MQKVECVIEAPDVYTVPAQQKVDGRGASLDGPEIVLVGTGRDPELEAALKNGLSGGRTLEPYDSGGIGKEDDDGHAT